MFGYDLNTKLFTYMTIGIFAIQLLIFLPQIFNSRYSNSRSSGLGGLIINVIIAGLTVGSFILALYLGPDRAFWQRLIVVILTFTFILLLKELSLIFEENPNSDGDSFTLSRIIQLIYRGYIIFLGIKFIFFNK